MRLTRESDKEKMLREIPLFRDLNRKDLDQIAKVAHSADRGEGEVLMRQGDPGAELMLILEGSARVEIDGHVVEEVGAMRVLGEMALLDSLSRTATVTTTSPCHLLIVPYFSFWDFVNRAPEVQRQLLVTMGRRIRSLYRQLQEAGDSAGTSYD